MCGIAGIFGEMANKNNNVTQMLVSMKHRGPDAQGVYYEAGIAIGAGRLWIRGDSTLVLPFNVHLEDGSTTYAAFNGQVYSAEGGLCEVEPLLKANIAIDGMYATALFNTAQPNVVILRRDYFGIKPLYYKIGANISFASEIPSLLAFSPGENDFSISALHETLLWGMPLGKQTLYRDIKKVLAGESLELHRDKKNHINIKKQIVKKCQSSSRLSLRHLIQSSLLKCLDSHHSVGLAVSGGLDSTVLAYELNHLQVENITTVSLKIEGSEDGLTDLSDMNFLKGGSWETWQHHSLTFSAKEFPGYIKEATKIFGQPQRMTSFPMYLKLADLAKESGVKVLLSGEGADELFFGYKSYEEWFASKSVYASIENQLLNFMLPIRFGTWFDALIGESVVQKLKADLLHYIEPLNGLSPLRALMELEKSVSLEPLLLRADICLMSRSIEGRVPFLHAGIPEYLQELSDVTIFNGGTLKPVLRESYRNCFPSYEIPKRPFRAPIHKWFTNELKDWVFHTLNDGLADLVALGFKKEGLRRFMSALGHDDFEVTQISYRLISIIYWYQWYRSTFAEKLL